MRWSAAAEGRGYPICQQFPKTRLQCPRYTGKKIKSVFNGALPSAHRFRRIRIKRKNHLQYGLKQKLEAGVTLRRVHEDCRAGGRRLLRLGHGIVFVTEGP